MTGRIKQRARELGFDDCRITTAAPPDSAVRFQVWLQQGRQGEMAYLERNAHKRVEPQLVLPGAQSIIVLAVSYGEAQSPKSEVRSPKGAGCRVSREPATQGVGCQGSGGLVSGQHATRNTQRATGAPPAPSPAGVVARYARYRDYHDVLAARLKELAEFVNKLGGGGTRSLWYVDTGPLLERALAQRAGLGFIGKHTNLIGRQLGNWIFLCEIITTLRLDPDEPEKNRCGSCARCLAACPTQAITAPFQLDARRCISYLTIELKGPIPVELRPAIGGRIYGCDDCLAVCPWNRFAREGSIMKAHARPELAAPDLLDLLSLDEAGFKRRFEGTPLLRIKRRGLLRNVCIALGNVGGEQALPALRKTTADPEPLVAEHACWAVAQIEARTAPQI